ncbi:MAG: hypothetical protein ASARMPREDX12_009270 [Alectoria sarmentosa]|nr:MAG: hypothetical protein ASARMPREDX12_009270 [Alectoria sarmentosa]
MSFGYSVGDAVLLTQLAWKTVQNARKACGEHDELTREVLSLHVVLSRLEQEVKKPGNTLNDDKPGDTYKEEMNFIVCGCEKVLNKLDQVLAKYKPLSEQERSGRRLWQQIRFGNGKMADLAEMRGKLMYYTSAISLFLNMVSIGTMGRVERQMNDAGGDLRDIKLAVNGITAHLTSTSIRHEGSVLTAYADDDTAVWKEFRRELVKHGFSSSVIRKHKSLIKAYIEELGTRGLLDEEDPNDNAENQYCEVDSVVEGAMDHGSVTWNNSKALLRPEAKVEPPVESKLPLEIGTEPNAASHSPAQPGHNEESIHQPASRAADRARQLPEERAGGQQEEEDSERRRAANHDRLRRLRDEQARRRVVSSTEPKAELRWIRRRVGSPTEPKVELRWIWLSNESNEENQHFLAEEVVAPKTKHGSSTATTDGDHDGSNDACETPKTRFESYIESDGSDIEVDKTYSGSEQGLPRQMTREAGKRDTEWFSRKSGKRPLGNEYDDFRSEYGELQSKEANARHYPPKPREPRDTDLEQESPMKNGKRELRNHYDELRFKEENARDHIHEPGDAVPSCPRPSKVASTINARTPPSPPPLTKNLTKSEMQDEVATFVFHLLWHEYYDDIAPDCIKWISQSIPSFTSRTLEKRNSADLSSLDSRCLDRISQVRRAIMALELEASPFAGERLYLIVDMNTMKGKMSRASNYEWWKDQRSKGKLYGVRVHENSSGDGLYISTGFRCVLCRPP